MMMILTLLGRFHPCNKPPKKKLLEEKKKERIMNEEHSKSCQYLVKMRFQHAMAFSTSGEREKGT